MTFRSLLRPLRVPATPPRPRPALESLEDRLAPAILHVGASETYHTITSALQAANPGDTVRVDPGTYQEAVSITKNHITLEGVNQAAVIRAPSSLAANDYALVWVNGATGVTIKDLTVEGPYNGSLTNVNGKLFGLHAGIFVSGGGSATITHDHVTDVRDNPPNAAANNFDGIGILVGSRSDILNSTGSAQIADNTIDNYQQYGIDVVNAGSRATIQNNTVTGLSLTLANQYLVQVGIGVTAGGTAVVAGNTVSQNEQTGANRFGYGMYLASPGAGVQVVGNTVTGNNTGLYLFSAQGAVIAGNGVSGSSGDGIDLVSTSGVALLGNAANNNGGNGVGLFGSSGNLVLLNQARHNGGDGLFGDAGSTGNAFLFNAMSDNSLFDAEDLSAGSGTAGTANIWFGNSGKTDNKGGGLLH